MSTGAEHTQSGSTELIDRFGRVHTDLRISVPVPDMTRPDQAPIEVDATSSPHTSATPADMLNT